MPAGPNRGLIPCLGPDGSLRLTPSEDAPPLEASTRERLASAFDRGAGHGLLCLGVAEIDHALPPVYAYWRELGSRFVTALCTRPDDEDGFRPPAPPQDLGGIAQAGPPMPGAEYLSADVLTRLWSEMGRAFAEEMGQKETTVQGYLKLLNPTWNVVGRVHFNLAENRKDEEAPFAFLATYTHRMSAQGKVQHMPLGEALREYAGTANKEALLSLLLPVQRASDKLGWLREMVEANEIYHPLRWSAGEALGMLRDVPELERAGVIVRMPAAWRAGRPPRPRVTATLGSGSPSALGTDALMDYRMEVTLDGEALTPAELDQILSGTSGLALIRGRWVEVDRERLEQTILRFQEVERRAAQSGIPFVEAMRMLSGVDMAAVGAEAGLDRDWSTVVAGPWLRQILKELRSPEGLTVMDAGAELRGKLRPYQEAGLRWLHLLSSLGLGACLADDMGLGKTIQVLALLLALRGGRRRGRKPCLLVAPASLLANWANEIQRFAPSLRALVAHGSVIPARKLASLSASSLRGVDLVITSYGALLRIPWLAQMAWDLAILDEAQAIKNPKARQTRAVKGITARARIALTGTPIENRLSDLWSIFDFLNPGLLGSERVFAAYTRRLSDRQHNPYGPLRDLVRPYILRRLKTDRNVISDLPDKTEVKAYCHLSRKQAALYQQAVQELADGVRGTEGMRRRGLILAFLMRLKQICNHPSQWLGDGSWAERDSGKWARLREIAEVIAAKQEKVLVFTQFREITQPIASHLTQVFGLPGLVLHGATAVKKRADLVRQFQEDSGVPFFVLSLRAGGSGLNLTGASHVVHVDRWWNPAVEDQATDRAFRIGQTRNVLVHKFVCRGTVEEKIDALIDSKKALSRELLEGGHEIDLTQLQDEELLKLVALDLKTAVAE